MTNRQILMGLVLSLAVFVFSLFAYQRFSVIPTSAAQIPSANLPTKDISINGKLLHLELATTPPAIEEGLGDRNGMDADHGMLFLFDTPSRYSFWMRHMRFPLDIIWFKGDTVVDLVTNFPNPGTVIEPPAIHEPVAEADRVLELVAGGAAAYGLEMGSVAPEVGDAR